MPHSFKLSRRFSRLRAPFFATLILALACDGSDSLDPTNSNIATDDTPVTTDTELDPTTELDPATELEPVSEPQLASASFAGGIPIGMNAMPISAFGPRFNGAKLTVGPAGVMSELSAIRSRGGKVALMLAGSNRYYKDGDGHFSLTKWKDRVSRFKGKDFEPYIRDGTIVGHYMIDEPNDKANWNGRAVPPSTLEEMAKFSKSIWPGMPTIVRTEPSYLDHNHRYLDVAWAQYLSRRGNVWDYIRRNVNDAQNRGLGLVVGMNVLKGGNPNGTRMTAREVEEWGSALLSSSYPCAFFSFEYNSDYLSSSDIRSAMDALRRKAENRSSRTCRGG
jgi:hypothetical protein